MDTKSVNFDKEHFRCFIVMAIQGQMAFQALMTVLDNLTQTLDKSKQLNRVLLEEIQKLLLSSSQIQNSDSCHGVSNQDENNSKDVEIIDETKRDDDTKVAPAEQGKSKAYGLKDDSSLHCKICHKKCRSNTTLLIHERFHTGEKPFQCNFCSKNFAQKENLQVHERNHTGEKLHVCKSCEKSFTTHRYLKIHERIHTGEKPYKCKGSVTLCICRHPRVLFILES